MSTTIVARENHLDLTAALDVWLREGWRIQGGLAYGNGQWAVLLVEEKPPDPDTVTVKQYPYKPERTMAYQEVAKHVDFQR